MVNKQVEINAVAMHTKRVIGFIVSSFVIITPSIWLLMKLNKDNTEARLWVLSTYVLYLFVCIIIGIFRLINSAFIMHDIQSQEFIEKEGYVSEKTSIGDKRYVLRINFQGDHLLTDVPKITYDTLDIGSWVKAIVTRDKNKKEAIQSIFYNEISGD